MARAGCQRGAAPGGAFACGPGPRRAAVRRLRICAAGSPRARRKRSCQVGDLRFEFLVPALHLGLVETRALQQGHPVGLAAAGGGVCQGGGGQQAGELALLPAQPGHLLARFQQPVLQQGAGCRRRATGPPRAAAGSVATVAPGPARRGGSRPRCVRPAPAQPQGFVVQHRAAGQAAGTGQAAQGHRRHVGSGAGHGGKGSRSGGTKCWRAASRSSRSGE